MEGAGGLLVPYAADPLRWQHELIHLLDLPVLVIARTGLGTLNHSFLTHRVLKSLNIPCLGSILVGPAHAENERDVALYTGLPVHARVEWSEDVDKDFDALATQLAKDLRSWSVVHLRNGGLTPLGQVTEAKGPFTISRTDEDFSMVFHRGG